MRHGRFFAVYKALFLVYYLVKQIRICRDFNMRLDEKWIRERLPEEIRNEPIDFFSCDYLDGLTVMQEGERGGDDVVVYQAKTEEDLKYWQLEQVCRFIKV